MNGLSFFQVRDDHLDPIVRRLDYVLLAPADRYLGEGYYLLSSPFDGSPASYQCTGFGESREKPIKLRIVNERYRSEPESVSKAEFSRRVVGKVVMTCNVHDHSLMDHHAIAYANRQNNGDSHVAC